MAENTLNTALTNDLKQLLLAGKVTTQENICTALQSLGHSLTQSKVSRLLRKIDAIKSKNTQGEIVYRLPQEPAPPAISSELSSLIIDIVANETTIIIYSSPGSAQLIARILDHHKQNLQILGTIAGDDTILIAPSSIKHLDSTINTIKHFLT